MNPQDFAAPKRYISVAATSDKSVRTARAWMRLPGALSREEMETLLGQPSRGSDPGGHPGPSVLELLYLTGLRVSELATDLNRVDYRQMGFLVTVDEDARSASCPSGSRP